MIVVFVAISVAFGIASVLSVSVVQRTREIGILRAMGATRQQILRIFLIQGAIFGLLGSIVGSGVSYILVWSFNTFWAHILYNSHIDKPDLSDYVVSNANWCYSSRYSSAARSST